MIQECDDVLTKMVMNLEETIDYYALDYPVCLDEYETIAEVTSNFVFFLNAQILEQYLVKAIIF